MIQCYISDIASVDLFLCHQMVLLASTKAKKVDHLRERRNNERQYVFDVVFGPDSSQEEVYASSTKHLVDNVMAGYNATVFAYGATGAGKTFTMLGAKVNSINDIELISTFHFLGLSWHYLPYYEGNIQQD